MAMAMTAALVAGCSDDDGGDDGDKTPPAAPVIELKDGDIKQTHEITSNMSVVVNVTAPGGIADFTVGIDSPCLTAEELGALGLAAQMNLVDPATEDMAAGLKGLGFAVGAEVKNKKTLSFDISPLVPMIALIYDKPSDHNFTLTVIDAENQRTIETLKFRLKGTFTVAYNDDADLWANTATLTAKNAPSGSNVQYRVKGSETWIDAAHVEGDVFAMAPVWESSKNAADLDIYTVQAGTGAFAATTYECRVMDGEELIAQDEFTTPAGDVIPNGDMSGWSKKVMTVGEAFDITYPNPEGQTFWDSGNNPFLENPTSGTFTPLCEEDKTEAGTAYLAARMVLNMVFAPGNMFTGDFNYTGLAGTVSFGKVYPWTARPRALKVRYKAQVGAIDKVGGNDPEKDAYKGQQDRSRIFAAVIDWTAQHGVTSGMTQPTGMWDPSTMTSVAEGAILGYGDLVITETADNWIEATLPINWYVEKAEKPAPENFSLVISCATSMRGDYLTGCSTNYMQVDDFEWVY